MRVDGAPDVFTEQGSSTDNQRRSDGATGDLVGVFARALWSVFVGMAWSSRSQVQGHKGSQRFQRSEPRCTLMLGERCVWFGAGLKYPSPSSCRLHE